MTFLTPLSCLLTSSYIGEIIPLSIANENRLHPSAGNTAFLVAHNAAEIDYKANTCVGGEQRR